MSSQINAVALLADLHNSVSASLDPACDGDLIGSGGCGALVH
jgi:hypothetical protein